MLWHMLIQTAESFFGGCAGIARALAPNRTVSAVYQWKKKGVVPLMAAQQLAELSGGKIEVDFALYDDYGNILNKLTHKKRA
jgi:hypothetical protein